MFINHIYQHARNNPDRLALIISGERISYAHLACAIEAARNRLNLAELPNHGVIASITQNLFYEWVLLLATRSLGLTTVSGKSWQAIEELGLSDIVGLVCLAEETDEIATFRAARPDCMVATVPGHLLAEAGSLVPPSLLPAGRFGDHIVYTSGTTGTYKKLRYAGDYLVSIIQHEQSTYSGTVAEGSVYYLYNFGPWTAAGAKGPPAIWHRGATVVFDQRVDWADHFNDYPITNTFLVPGLLQHFQSNVAGLHPDLQIMVGGGFLDAKLARDIRENLKCKLLISYGGSEFCAPLEQYFESDEDIMWLSPNGGAQFEIVDEANRVVPVGIEGELRVHCMSIYPTEYLEDHEATAKHFRDGWFYPGDLAVEREDGRVRVLGRANEVLNLGGEKIPLGPIEQAAREALEVEDLCIFAFQDTEGSDVVAVVIEGDGFPDRTRLEALARDVLRTARLRFITIDRFPRGENGMMKINRKKVLEIVRTT